MSKDRVLAGDFDPEHRHRLLEALKRNARTSMQIEDRDPEPVVELARRINEDPVYRGALDRLGDEWLTDDVAAKINAAASESGESFASMEDLLDDLHDDQR